MVLKSVDGSSNIYQPSKGTLGGFEGRVADGGVLGQCINIQLISLAANTGGLICCPNHENNYQLRSI